MNIRKATEKDINKIVEIYNQASRFIFSYGSDQWQNEACPNEKNAKDDIEKSNSYVLTDENDDIIATMCLSFSPDPNYKKIVKGRWESDFDYSVIHRIAIKDEYRGTHLSKLMFDFAENKTVEKGFRSVRIDTHQLNEPLKTILKHRKYKKCGIIFLENGEERLAYEKILIPFKVNDFIELKKSHPCGNDIFEIFRTGADFRLECIKCHSQIWLSRSDVNKRLKKRLSKEDVLKIKNK